MKFLEEKLALPNICAPARCLLGDFGEEELPASKKNSLKDSLFYAKKALALKWKDPRPPSLLYWVDLVNGALPKYKLTYNSRGCPKKFITKHGLVGLNRCPEI